MPLFRVFHVNPTSDISFDEEKKEAVFRCSFGEVADAVRFGIYREAALVEAPDIHQVFPMTNHISGSWTLNDGVIRHADQVRSTSVGDIVIDVDSGKLFCCATIGWREIDDLLSSQFRQHLGGVISILENCDIEPSP